MSDAPRPSFQREAKKHLGQHFLHEKGIISKIVQEVLAEVLLRAALELRVVVVAVHAAIRWRARRTQVSTAANRLAGSAMPRPARSSAVPWSTATRG